MQTARTHPDRQATWMALFALVTVGFLLPATARAGQITVVSGTYGANCGRPTGNMTAHLAAACNGRSSCDYKIDYTVIGDPAPGCAKDYIASWTCDGRLTSSAVTAPEAGLGSIVRLSCTTYAKAAGAVTCPESTKVTTEDECKRAGAAVGHPFEKSVDAGRWTWAAARAGASGTRTAAATSIATWPPRRRGGGTGGICRGSSAVELVNVTPDPPPRATKRPAEVAGATISATTLKNTMIWMTQERLLSETPFCYRRGYDRGIGHAPSSCGPGKDARGAFCYDECRSGFSDNGTPTCVQTDCPSGYSPSGPLLCHADGEAMYSPVGWDSCASHAPDWLGGGCIGAFVEDDCREGFHKTLSMCYLDIPDGMSGSPLDPMRASYTRGVNGTPGCDSDRVLDVGMCYVRPKDNYTCNVTNCNPSCASGTVECGPAACAATAMVILSSTRRDWRG